jgi:hypothetical protein
MKINQIIESTTAGSVASVAMPLGNTQKRAGSLFKGKKTKKKFYEGKMKDLAHDLEYMSPTEFKKKYGQTKDEVRQSLKEEEIKEQDLIVVPGMRKSKDSSFIPHEKDRRDHEVEMARSDLYAAAKDAMRIYKMIQTRSEDEGLMGWQQSYITLASDYLNSVADSLVHETTKQEGIKGGLAGAAVGAAVTKTPKGMATGYKLGSLAQDTISNMKEGAGVIAGGMSNFEESRYGRYYDPMGNERREQDAMDADRRRFKHDELSAELSGEEEAIRRANEGPWYVRIDGKLVRDKNKDPYVFNTLEAARKAAQTMMKKDWNQGKQFSYSRSPTDKTDVTEGKLGKALAVGAMSLASIGAKAHTDTTKSVADLAKERPAVAALLQKIGAQGQAPASDKRAAELQRKQDQEMPASDRRAKELEKNESKKHKCPSCGGELVSEELMNEKKDACYYKVKSRYKVWPSAYASGALVKCRKKGAKNWGSKSK